MRFGRFFLAKKFTNHSKKRNLIKYYWSICNKQHKKAKLDARFSMCVRLIDVYTANINNQNF